MYRPQGVLNVVLLLFVSSVAFSQLSKADTKRTIRLDELFEEYHLTSIEDLNKKATNSFTEFTIRNNDRELISLVLSPSNLLSSEHIVSGTSQLIGPSTLAIPYMGYIKGDPSSAVRVTLLDQGLYGTFSHKNIHYYVEPASNFDKSIRPGTMIIYTGENVKSPDKVTCASQEFHKRTNTTKAQTKSAGSCRVYELAIALDYSYVQKHGGVTGAINQSIAVMNMVAADYENAFSDDVRFEVVEHFVSDCSTCDPWTNTTDASDLLNEFTAWGHSGFFANHDIGQFWTDRNICGTDCSVAGLAWIDVVCGSWKYHILEDFTSTSWQLRILVSHEMGHNFGSFHDSGSGHIMGPSIVVNTSTWSSQSTNAINTAMQSFTCYHDCVIGSCTEILDLWTSNCIPSNPSTYDLTLEIRHGGGGTSNSFDVNVNGQSFNFAWGTSPQTVVISGLVADGTLSNSVTISADDGSDVGCNGSASYDEPTDGCSITVTEDFNSCQLPAGWSESSTNIYTWNGGDPLVQYEWKFDDATRYFLNYDNDDNATSLKTIDGTCMALMDDDIFNHSLYTGEIVLTTEIYDVSEMDTVKVSFDYNFHPFEDGGKGSNSSYFEVEAYDGNLWKSVLFDNDSSCPWSNVWPNTCTTNVELDLSTYKNEAFRMRFIYNDGEDGKWTGMIALDNFEINGTVTQSSSLIGCEDIVQISDLRTSGDFSARDMIMTTDSIIIDGQTTFSAAEVVIDGALEVPTGVEFTVSNESCDQ